MVLPVIVTSEMVVCGAWEERRKLAAAAAVVERERERAGAVERGRDR